MWLKPAITIGGTVIDPDGRPISGARVELYSEYFAWDNRPGKHNVASLEVQTGTDGRWGVNRIAEEIVPLIRCQADHPEYLRSEIVEVGQNPDFEALLRAGECILRLRRGATVRGVVANESGEPILGATVTVGLLTDSSRKTVSTAPDGRFELVGCEPGLRPVTAAAARYAPTVIETEISENTPPIRLVLRRGTSLRFRVLDTEGRPIANVSFGLNTDHFPIELVRSAGVETPQTEFRGLTDSEGRGLWENAPDR